MELKQNWFAANNGFIAQILHWVNLRPEESDRTLLMFAAYTTTSIGLRWAEDSVVALFLDKYGAKNLPWIYIASALIGMALVVFYSWLQRIYPLRWVVVAIAPSMVVPLFFLYGGLQIPYIAIFSVFLLRLWVDALYVVNELNTSITANQLFNIREIKRTYPLVSSGILVADVLSGYSLPWLLRWVPLDKVILAGAVVIVIGAVILGYLCQSYQKAFPDVSQKDIPEVEPSHRKRLKGPIKDYVLRLFAFIGLVQIIGLLIDFQYLSYLESNFKGKDIASFLGLFGGTVGVCELVTQWFFSSRALERLGVFVTAATLPASVAFLMPLGISVLSFLPGIQSNNFFWGLVGVKFVDELLRYTFVTSSGPLLFQPIPDRIRSRVQALSGGIAEAIATGFGGLLIIVTLWVTVTFISPSAHNVVLVLETTVLAVVCLSFVWLMRERYVDLLVKSAERGQLSATDVDLKSLKEFKEAASKALRGKATELEKRSCIELLAQIDPQSTGEVLAPLLFELSGNLQAQSLEVMLIAGVNPTYLPSVRPLLDASKKIVPPEVYALALRYVWLAEENSNLTILEDFLHPRKNPIIRATAATLLLRLGKPIQKATATNALRRMLTHKKERERISGVLALRDAEYLQALRLYIPDLLQDDSLRVRCAVLEMIASTHLEEHYSALLAGLKYKSTRNIAIKSLVKLGNEVIPLLVDLASNLYKEEVVRMYAWRTIGQIGTMEATDTLWMHLESSWGSTRGYILRSLLKIHKSTGINSLVDRLHESRVENLILQELGFLGEIYGAYIDFEGQARIYAQYIEVKVEENNSESGESRIQERILSVAELLQRALLELEVDIKERLLLFLRLLYSDEVIQAATFNLHSHSTASWARGLEILEHTIKLPSKTLLLTILDKRSYTEKLQALQEAGITKYEQTVLSDRTYRLLLLGNLLSDWCLACCFHFAEVGRIRLTVPQILANLRHPTGFVREATLSYLSVASPEVLKKILPQLKDDPHPLVATQVKELIKTIY
jgi:ATP/ADP translocase